MIRLKLTVLFGIARNPVIAELSAALRRLQIVWLLWRMQVVEDRTLSDLEAMRNYMTWVLARQLAGKTRLGPEEVEAEWDYIEERQLAYYTLALHNAKRRKELHEVLMSTTKEW